MKKLKFLVSLIMEENQYQRLHASVVRDVAGRLGVDVQILYAGNDAIAQSEQLLNTIHSPATRPDGIICAPVGTTLMSVAKRAVESGIGWAVLNRECDYITDLRRNSSAPVFFVTPDQSEIGRLQGRQMEALCTRGGLILYILGPAGNPIVDYRRSWMLTTKPANIQVRTLTGDWSEQSGYKAISGWLQLRTSRATAVNLVAAQCDDMALGAKKAFEELTEGEERTRWASLPFIGCDGCPEAGQEWVRRGLLTSTVVIPSTAGPALEMMVRAIQTKSQLPESTSIAPASFPPLEKLGRPSL
ncbi:MAG TPA: sugar ABC transporter substrate-binding protein [Terriglobales bacterium]|jgi:ABC-type sugar transport system substrate-binding protein|nr:sugar ABC transporter substrate-binding protein [Terriglobales bacterium]